MADMQKPDPQRGVGGQKAKKDQKSPQTAGSQVRGTEKVKPNDDDRSGVSDMPETDSDNVGNS